MKLSFLQRAALAVIRLYQWTLSPDTGWFSSLHPYGVCRFTPTCSAYTAVAIERRGFVRGLWGGARRILRCHPWQAGGHDPVQE
ncbi:MAG: membrane protein insertion efficiency factor YidD [bacterium]